MRRAVVIAAALSVVYLPVQRAGAAPSFASAGRAVVAIIWVHPDASGQYSAFFGAVVGRGAVLTVAHGLRGARPGDRAWVLLSGFHSATAGPVPASPAQAYWREGTIRAVCPEVDLARVDVPAVPAGIQPLTAAEQAQTALYVLNIGAAGTLQVTPAQVTGGEFARPLGAIARPQPAVALARVKAQHGWSGSPIVTAAGRLAGLLISTTTSSETTAGYSPASWFAECR